MSDSVSNMGGGGTEEGGHSNSTAEIMLMREKKIYRIEAHN